VFYDITDIGFAMAAIVKQFNLSDNDVKFVAIAFGLLGYIVGSLLIGAFADRRGRRLAFLTSLVVSGLGSFDTAFATRVISLSFWRFLAGIGVRAALNLASMYVGELSPASQRGRIPVSMFMVGIVGQAITPFVAFALVPNFEIGWRILFLIGAFIGIAGVIFGRRLLESLRWLIEQGRLDEAEAMVSSVELRFDPKDLAVSVSPIAGEFQATASTDDDEHTVSTMYELTHGRYGLTVLAMVAMWFLWRVGNYGFLGDAATLFSAHGMGICDSILYLAVGAIGYLDG